MADSIYCLEPVLIRVHNLQYLLINYRCFHTPSGWHYLSLALVESYYVNFPKWRYSPRRMGVTVDNYKDFYILDDSTGVIFYMFQLVPCGHCTLCGSRRSSEWQFRAVAETVTSSNTPYFVTLTYNDKYLPATGVSKYPLQLFFKRLRVKLQRLGISCTIKYFACAEYGKDTHRPHYHVLIWGFPDDRKDLFPNITSILHFIEDCWSVYTYDFSRKTWFYDPIGFAYCKPCDSGAFSYVSKYMTKPCYVPDGKNPTFFLSSHGIGAAYCERYRDFYLQNPEKLDISVCDPVNGEVITAPLPKYFVNKYFPSLSVKIPKYIRQLYFDYLSLLRRRYTVVAAIERSSFDSSILAAAYPTLTPDDSQVLSIYHSFFFEEPFDLSVDYKFEHLYFNASDKFLNTSYYDLTFSIDSAVSVLLAHSSDVALSQYAAIRRLASRRSNALARAADSRPIRDLVAIANKIETRYNRARSREIIR